MMKISAVCAAALALITAGCISVQTYTSAEHQKYRAADLKTPARPYAVKVESSFFRNGQPLPAFEYEFAKTVENAVQKTKVAVPYRQAENTLKISGNNIADLRYAAGQGFKTGFTLGMAGSTVQDVYEFTCSYLDKNQVLLSETYPHAIVSTIGNTVPPAGLVPRGKLPAAFQTVVGDVVTNCLGDIQKSGHLTGQ